MQSCCPAAELEALLRAPAAAEMAFGVTDPGTWSPALEGVRSM
jgi:hypothetical protein